MVAHESLVAHKMPPRSAAGCSGGGSGEVGFKLLGCVCMHACTNSARRREKG